MGLRHFLKLRTLVDLEPKFRPVIEKELGLRKYGHWVPFYFWQCMKLLRFGHEPIFKECLRQRFAEHLIKKPGERPVVEKFLRELPELQEKVRDFLTEFYRKRAKYEKIVEERKKAIQEEAKRIGKLLEEIF